MNALPAMQGLWLDSRLLSFRDDLPVPTPPPGEALIRVRCEGVCSTDLELLKGYYPYSGIPGHEFVGQVEQAMGAEHWLGRRVVGEIGAACGRCSACLGGRKNHCEGRTVLGIVNRHGAMAEWLALPVENLHAVPENLPDEAAVFAEPLAAALRIQEQRPIGRGEQVLVVGAGKLGNLVAQSLGPTGCDLLVIGRHSENLDLLARRGIRTGTAEALPERSMDVVVECTGNPAGIALARRAVRPGGTVVLKSTYRGEASLDLSGLVVDEVTLLGSRCGPFTPALDLLARKEVEVASLIHARYPLREGKEAFAHAARPGVLKVLLYA